MSQEKTTVETVDVDLDSLLNIGDSVMLPSDKEAKPSLFTRDKVDLSFLDKPTDVKDKVDETPAAPADGKEAPAAPKEKVDLSDLDNIINLSSDEDSTKGGRPKVDKQGLVELTTKLIEKGLIVPFEGDEDVSKYTLKDFEELFEANTQEIESKAAGKITESFFESLPPEFQYAYQYIQNGGNDLKGLFKTLAQVEEVRQMDPANESEAKHIARSYLQAKHNDWTPEEIEEEIAGYEDRGELEQKAAKFKPKLDALTEQEVRYKLAQQEKLRQQQAAQAQMYMDNIYKMLEPGELNGLRLDRKTQNLLFQGLVQPAYQSASGGATNLLGHLLERYQYIEPNHQLLAEALWLLADPEAYKNKVREVVKKDVTAETVRKLKSEQTRKIASHVEDADARDERPSNRLARPSQNFFKR